MKSDKNKTFWVVTSYELKAFLPVFVVRITGKPFIAGLKNVTTMSRRITKDYSRGSCKIIVQAGAGQAFCLRMGIFKFKHVRIPVLFSAKVWMWDAADSNSWNIELLITNLSMHAGKLNHRFIKHSRQSFEVIIYILAKSTMQ